MVSLFDVENVPAQINDRSATRTLEEVPSVTFCRMVSRPDVYMGQMIRVRAIFLSTWDWRALYDPMCISSKKRVWPELECDTVALCTEMASPLNRELLNDSYGVKVALTVVGRLRRREKREAALGGLELAFDIYHIEQAKRLPTVTRVPKNPKRKDKSKRPASGKQNRGQACDSCATGL